MKAKRLLVIWGIWITLIQLATFIYIYRIQEIVCNPNVEVVEHQRIVK